MQPITILTWLVVVFIGFVELLILWQIASGKINLRLLISESDGVASMSRFQMLLFTFVVAASLFIITMTDPGKGFPNIPDGILTLLGISLGTYAVSKGIQTQGEISKRSADEAATKPQ